MGALKNVHTWMHLAISICKLIVLKWNENVGKMPLDILLVLQTFIKPWFMLDVRIHWGDTRHKNYWTAVLIWLIFSLEACCLRPWASVVKKILFVSLSFSQPFSASLFLLSLCLSLFCLPVPLCFLSTYPISILSNFHRTNAKGSIFVSSAAITHCVM